VRHVALERNAVVTIVFEPCCSGRVAVGAVSANQRICSDFLAADAGFDRVVDQLERHAVTKVGPRFGSTFGEEMIEPAALRQQNERLSGRALEVVLEVEPEREPGRAILDHRLDGEGQLTYGAHRQPAAARLVAGKGRTVDEQDAGPLAAEPVGGGRAGGPGPDDQHVEPSHPGREAIAVVTHRGDAPGPETPKLRKRFDNLRQCGDPDFP
jgi:hypothetical protein